MIVKQARAVYLDRLLPVVTGAGICEHPALYPGVSRNAYLLLTSHSACSMILPGLLVPPFADERYDDASLAIAHRLRDGARVHARDRARRASGTRRTRTPSWAPTRPRRTLRPSPTWAPRRRHARFAHVDNETVCASVSQLFCGRVGWMPVLDDPPPWHPPTNMRGDNMCLVFKGALR